jgi:ATP-dependent Clp protease ATP-binding subunit ClpA
MVCSGRQEVTGANVLVAISAEHESPAAHSLQEQEMTRDDAIKYIGHGIKKGGTAAELLIGDITPPESKAPAGMN